MSKRTLHFLLMLLVGIVGGILNYFFCCNCCGNTKVNSTENIAPAITPIASKPTAIKAPTRNSFILDDTNGNFNLKTNDHFNFNANGFTVLKPLSNTVDVQIDKLKPYLELHKEKTLDIIGLYTSKEKNPSGYSNLGIARANAVKNYLVSKGISSKQLNTLGKLNDNLIPDQTIYYGPVNYHFNTSNSAEDIASKRITELALLRKEIIANPLKLNFETNSSILHLSNSQRAKMGKLSRYLDKADSGQLLVTGHTDSTGDYNANLQLGKSRAGFIADYLAKNGIDRSKISTLSKSSDKPIASNETEEGRRQNRRVEITLK